MRKLAKVFVLAGLLLVLDVGVSGGLGVGSAQARVGRPLTPMSYAGVARRTTRRAYRYGGGGYYHHHHYYTYPYWRRDW